MASQFVFRAIDNDEFKQDISIIDEIYREHVDSAEWELNNTADHSRIKVFLRYADALRRIRKTYQEAKTAGVIIDRVPA